MKKAKSLSSILVVLTLASVASVEFLVPSSEIDFETQRSLTLPMTLECPYVRHKYIEIHGVTLLNGSDILIASSLAPNIEQVVNEECFASLEQSDSKPVSCAVSMQALPQDGSIDQMEKIVTFDCRNSLGDPSGGEKTISKKKGTIKIKCDNKESVPEITQISLASGQGVDKISFNWQCNQENIKNIVIKGQKYGGQCQIKRKDYLNDSEMTVTYKCNDPPRRDIEEFVQGNGNRGRGNRDNKN